MQTDVTFICYNITKTNQNAQLTDIDSSLEVLFQLPKTFYPLEIQAWHLV